MLVVTTDGWAGDHYFTGYFFRQARFLRELRLHVGPRPLHVCSIAEVAPHELELTYIHPEVSRGGTGGSGSGGLTQIDELLHRNLDIRLNYVLHPAALEITAVIISRWQEQVELDLSWTLSADFATVDEAQFDYRDNRWPVDVRTVPNGVVFAASVDALRFETHIRAGGATWTYRDGALRARTSVARQQPLTLSLRVDAIDANDPIDQAGAARREAKLARWHEHVTELHAAAETPLVTRTNRAVRDLGSLALLEGPEAEWLTPGAGVPLYLTLWGRDALTASWQAGLFDRGDMIADVVSCLTRLQGSVVDAARDEQPGRIINQAKTDPLSRLGRSGFDRYYADVASPFMYIIALGYHYTLTGDNEHVAQRYDAAMRVLDWADRYGDRDGDGYIEYLTLASHGPRHQGWKDSENAVVDAAGNQVEPPIAPCEIQGYWYVSLQFMAMLSVVMHQHARAVELWQRASELKERFNRDFWMEDEGFVAFGLDSHKQQIRALTSNAGQCLPTGILTDDHVTRLVRRMFEPDMFSGWGIRTLSSANPAFHPLDYHLGSVWPVENASILFGLRRYGLDDRVQQLARALYDLAMLWPQGRTPECVGGYARADAAHPGAYPRANRPQAWNESVWPILMQSLLGLVPFAPLHLLLIDPMLPPWLPELTVKRLRVGDATVSLDCYRDADGRTQYEVTEQDGKLRVVRQPWLESFSTDNWERLRDLLATAFAH